MNSLDYPAESGDQMTFPPAQGTTTSSGGGVNAATVLAKDTPQAAHSSAAAGVPAPPPARTSRDDHGQMPPVVASAGKEVTAAAGDGEAHAAAARPRVIGVDVSLTSTGVAGPDWALTIAGGSLPRTGATLQQKWTRISRVRARLLEHIDHAQLVVIEGPSFGSNDPGAHERAALWWRIVGRCLSREIPLAVVAPSTLKVYATGSGKAAKEDVVQEVQRRRPDVAFRGNDQADALVLAAMGLDHLGHPVMNLPKTHRRALDSVDWPEAVR